MSDCDHHTSSLTPAIVAYLAVSRNGFSWCIFSTRAGCQGSVLDWVATSKHIVINPKSWITFGLSHFMISQWISSCWKTCRRACPLMDCLYYISEVPVVYGLYCAYQQVHLDWLWFEETSHICIHFNFCSLSVLNMIVLCARNILKRGKEFSLHVLIKRQLHSKVQAIILYYWSLITSHWIYFLII